MNTAQSGVASFKTKKIFGEIKALCINSPKQVKIQVNLDSMREIILVNEIIVTGQVYWPLRTEAVVADNIRGLQQFNYAPQPYVINDSLNFVIEAQKNVNVDVEIFYDG